MIPVPWYKSQRFTAIWHAGVAYLFFWLVASFAAKAFDFWGLGEGICAAIAALVADWRSPNVQAPAVLGFLNKGNTLPEPPGQ